MVGDYENLEAWELVPDDWHDNADEITLRNVAFHIKKKTLQKADILKTHGDNKKVLKITKFKKFNHWKLGIDKTIKWYSEFYKDRKKI